MAVRCNLSDTFRNSVADAAGSRIQPSGFGGVFFFFPFYPGKIHLERIKHIAQFFEGQDSINCARKLRLFCFGLFGQARPDKHGTDSFMQLLGNAPAGNHR